MMMQALLSFGYTDRPNVRPEMDTSNLLYGKLQFVDLVFVDSEKVTVFHTCRGSFYQRFTFCCCAQVGGLPCRKGPNKTLLLNVSTEEARKMFLTATAFTELKTPFNTWDILMYHAPFRTPEDKCLFSLTTMNDVQSIILFFRECLDASSPTRQATEHLHSRVTLCDTLYLCVFPCAVCVVITKLADFIAYSPAITNSLTYSTSQSAHTQPWEHTIQARRFPEPPSQTRPPASHAEPLPQLGACSAQIE
jgi:hypothetical protein